MDQTTTLADALLDDLNDLMDSDEEADAPPTTQSEPNIKSEPQESSMAAAIDSSIASQMMNNNIKQELSKPEAKAPKMHLKPSLVAHLEYISKLDASQEYQEKSQKEREEEDHHLVVKSNKFLSNLADELEKAHGALATAYKPKFPELEELLPNYVQFKNAVRVIWNEMDLTKVNDELNEILNSNQIITISVAGSTTSGRILTKEELAAVDEAATYMENLLDVQTKLIDFVVRSMEGLAPSVCALIGPSTAARLIGLVGGLAELTKIPSCNLQVIGQVKQNSTSRAGMSNASTKRHVGILADCDLVKSVPKQMQKKALKLVAAKLALVARFDYVNVDSGRTRSANTGLQFRTEIENKFEKLQEPDKAPVLKALPKPDLAVKKRRGGKRMRRWKDRFEETAMMKQANTRAFSEQHGEYGDDAMGISMGLLDTADTGGAIRKTTEKRKMRQANSKASRKRAMQMAQQAKNNDGLASSVVFSQSSSMELVNPDANRNRVKEANKKWFKDNAGFQSALPKK